MQGNQVGGRPPLGSVRPQVLLCFLGNYQQLQLFCVPQYKQRAAHPDPHIGQQAMQIIHSSHGLAFQSDEDIALP